MAGVRTRLRPAYSDEELARIYATPHQHERWEDHKLRVKATIDLARSHVQDVADLTAADLSCGDAAILRGVYADRDEDWTTHTYLGDYAPGYMHMGPLEQTIHEIPGVDLYVCSETIEHLDDPDAALKLIRAKADRLILSTPIGEDNDGNPEHYWGWDTEAVREMLVNAGWEPVTLVTLNFRPTYVYDYQIWACR